MSISVLPPPGTGEYLRPRLQGYRLVKGVYVPMKSRQADWLSSRELGLDFTIEAHLLRVVDPKTGRRLPTREEHQEQLKLARREVRKAKRAATEAKGRSAELEAEVERLRGLVPPDKKD